MDQPIRVLVVDDLVEYGRMIAEFVRHIDRQAVVDVAASYDDALRAFERYRYQLAFFDYWLGSYDGLALLREVRRRAIDTPIIVMTGRGDEEVAVEAMKAGAADYLGKTAVTPESLGAAMRHALALHAKERERRDVEAALRVSEERFRALVENSSDAVVLLDREGRVSYVSPSSHRHFGYPPAEMLDRSVLDLLHPDDRGVMTARMADLLRRAGEPIVAEVRLQHRDGSWRAVELIAQNRLDESSVGAIVVNARDVTDRQRLEERLRQSQKMEAVGRLAGGIAHDFNNLLTAILGYCNLMLDEVPVEDPLRQDLTEIRSAGERAASLTRQLLAFSRRQMLQPQELNINTLVSQLERLFRRLIGEDIELVTALAPNLLRVKADPSSVEQVLVNLAVNARDAMPLGGRLTIETHNVELDSTYAASHVTVVPGRYVMVAVSDTGAGMDEITKSRIFEPFFTTKEQGRGIGLGLATVYGIVKQSGGYIWVYTEPHRGTSFKVYLPVSPCDVDVRGTAPVDRESHRGWETVLLVEDEDAVRALAREVLRRHGYTVIEARHGLDGLRMAERHSDSIHLLISDVVMPHMSGRDLAERLSAVRPRMKVLFMSGYADHAVMHRDVTPGSAFLQKPFTPDVFAKTVRTVLDERTAGLAEKGRH